MTRRRRDAGQSMIEFAIALPFLTLLALGLIELSSALLDQHVVTRLAREGSNLISRDTTLQDAVTAMRSMATRPVNFDNGTSTLILSVIKNVPTVGAANYNQNILYQRVQYGTLSASSLLQTRGSGSFGGAPDYQANNSDNDTSLQLTNLPPGLLTTGGLLYVTEIYSTHTMMTPLDNFGVHVPPKLYSIAYF
ncbi:MAG TPA: TadE/TadG family type IV pilus assembly protein [Vicinamibacterales bacterium]|nr:TadE/TadG family type IV pilus assembly protein [Vicinamibacterales bacterium]